MSFKISDIKKIAHLSSLAISDEQANELAGDFSKILTLVEKMKGHNTDDVEPLSHPFDITQPTRTDKVTEPNQRDKMQAIAPEVKAGLYIVPQFIETE